MISKKVLARAVGDWSLKASKRSQIHSFYHAFELVFDILQVLYAFIFMRLADFYIDL